MPLVVAETGRNSRPRIICDLCREPITDASHGNVHWAPQNIKQRETCSVFFTHKTCCRVFDRSHHAGGSCAMELSWFIGKLVKSLRPELLRSRK
jgi:hypothetical protein